jgi:hypothetical protein
MGSLACTVDLPSWHRMLPTLRHSPLPKVLWQCTSLAGFTPKLDCGGYDDDGCQH